MRSPEMIGEACASPGSGVCQRMFCPVSTFHEVGSALLPSTPQACGPRNCGQSAVALVKAVAAITATKRKRLIIIRLDHKTKTPARWQETLREERRILERTKRTAGRPVALPKGSDRFTWIAANRVDEA